MVQQRLGLDIYKDMSERSNLGLPRHRVIIVKFVPCNVQRLKVRTLRSCGAKVQIRVIPPSQAGQAAGSTPPSFYISGIRDVVFELVVSSMLIIGW